MQLVIISLLSFVAANATLDKSGHMMYVEYSINEPSKGQGVIYVDILFHYKGETYKVARHRYPEPVTSIVDTFPWVSKDKWEGGDLEVVAKKADGSVERSYIPEKSIEVRDLGYQMPEFEHKVNGALVKVNNGPDPYAWRMLGYDPGHTGYYPFHLYPPLEFKWILRDWGHPGSWITEVSGAAGHEMLFIPKSVRQWNIITARDIETGEIIWERYVTANVMTSALCIGDSILFVGSVIGFTPWQDTTFYALDPFTGELKWGKVFKTVEYSPIVVESLVYAPSLGLPAKLGCWNYRGDSIWTVISWMSDGSPAYYNGVVFHTGLDTLTDPYVLDSTLYARDYRTGEFIWDFTRNGWIFTFMSYEEKVIFSPSLFDRLYALNVVNGDIVWTSFPIANLRTGGAYKKVWYAHSQYINDTLKTRWVVLDSNTGLPELDTILTPADTNSGRTGFPLSSSDSIFWITNCSRIYVFKNHVPLYETDLPESPAIWPSWNFPIFYKNYFIYAHEDFLVIYEADTVDTSGQDTLTDFQVYLLYTDGDPVLRLNIPDEGQINLKLFSIAGREVWEKQAYFEKGSHFIDLPSLPSGVYMLFYDFEGEIGTKKVLLLRQSRK